MTAEIERDENAYVFENSEHQLEQQQNEIEHNNKNEDDLNLREKFNVELIRPIIRRILNAELTNASYESLDVDCTKKISNKVKQAMLEIEPKHFKYVVFVNASKNLNQGVRADASMHWEIEADTFVQDIYQSDKLICMCLAFAIRI